MSESMNAAALENIYQGRLLHEANEAIKAASKDVIERHGVDKPRVVTVKIEIAPDYNAEIEQNYPQIKAEVKKSIPGAKFGKQVAQVINGEVQVSTSPHFADPEKAQMRIDEKPENVTQLKAGSE